MLEAFADLKRFFGHMVRLAPDALHIHVGLLVFFIVVLLVRGRRGLIAGLYAVLVLSLAAEVLDLARDLVLGQRVRWLNSVKDIVNAVFWPAILTLAGSRILEALRGGEPSSGRGPATGPDPTAVRPVPSGKPGGSETLASGTPRASGVVE